MFISKSVGMNWIFCRYFLPSIGCTTPANLTEPNLPLLQHLDESTVPPGDQYAEMICPACVARLPFLQSYTALAGKIRPPECDNISTLQLTEYNNI